MTDSDNQGKLRYETAPRRRTRMLSTIVDQGFCTITELANSFQISEMTARRDAQKLAESESGLRIVHGGISAVPLQQSEGTDYRMRAMSNHAAKQAIAAEVIRMLQPNVTIAIDSGTTGIAIAEAIPGDISLNVVTQSLAAANILLSKDNIEVTVLGGTLIRSLQAFAGPSTIAAIADLRIELFFLSATSIDERGVLAGNDFDAATKRALVDAADKVVLVSDSSKFSLSSRFRVCSLGRISTLVTDDRLLASHRQMVDNAGVTLIESSLN